MLEAQAEIACSLETYRICDVVDGIGGFRQQIGCLLEPHGTHEVAWGDA